MLGGLAVLGSAPACAGWFDSAPSEPPVNDDTIAQIQRALDDERYVDAGNMLDEELITNGDNPKVANVAGQLALARGRYNEALAYFKKADSDPALSGRALEGEGIALSLLGKSDEAVTALQAAVAKDATAWHAWNALGAEFDRRHDWQKAEAAYDQAAASSNSAAIVLNNRGFSRLCQKRLDAAVADFVEALRKKPDLTATRNNLRLAIAMQGEYQRAMEGADATDRAAVLNNVGFAAMLRGDYTEAENLFGEAMKVKGAYYALAASNLEIAKDLESGHGNEFANAHAVAH